MATNGPSFMREIFALTITPQGGSAITVYGTTKLATSQKLEVVYGKDNNVEDPIASHVVGRVTSGTIGFEDFAAYSSLLAAVPYFAMSFALLPPGQTIVTSPNAAQTITIASAVYNSLDQAQDSKVMGAYTLSYTALGLAAGTNPIVVTATSGAPTGNTGV